MFLNGVVVAEEFDLIIEFVEFVVVFLIGIVVDNFQVRKILKELMKV